MRNALRFFLFVCFVFTIAAVQQVSKAQAGTLVEVIAADGRLGTFRSAIDSAELGAMLSSSGPYTVFAPTDAAFAVLPDDALTNPNAVRTTVLHHTLLSAKNSGNLSIESSMTNALEKQLTVSQENGQFVLNGSARVIVTDIEASNGILHIVDVVLDPNAQVAQPEPVAESPPPPPPGQAPPSGEAAPDSAESAPPPPPPTPTPEPKPQSMPETNLVLVEPSQNPAYKGEGKIAYWTGIQSDRTTCKGTTWVVMKQMDGVTFVGSDRQTNPYRGDTGCATPLPVLCFNRDFSSPPPLSSRGENYADGWAGGRVRATVPVPGTNLPTEQSADQLCEATFGLNWRMAEFHDAAYGAQIGEISGWDMWAYGGLNNNQRYWIKVGDQPANPWNSQRLFYAPEGDPWADQVVDPSQNAAYAPGEKVQPSFGFASGRAQCKGMTWTVLKQQDGLVLVGSDALTNPYSGDTNCNERLPILCINVEGFSPPANANGNNYSESWSGANVKQTYPFTGHDINTRDKANQRCVEVFGEGWRIAEFHDGALGTAGTDGWKLWAYGGLTNNRRFWVSINDQAANPWSPHAGGN